MCMHIYTYVQMHACMYTCVCIYIHMCRCMHVYEYVHVYLCTHAVEHQGLLRLAVGKTLQLCFQTSNSLCALVC